LDENQMELDLMARRSHFHWGTVIGSTPLNRRAGVLFLGICVAIGALKQPCHGAGGATADPAAQPVVLREPLRLGAAYRAVNSSISGSFVSYCPDTEGQVIIDLNTGAKVFESKDNYATRLSGHTALWGRGGDFEGYRLDQKNRFVINPAGKNGPPQLSIGDDSRFWGDWVGFIHSETVTRQRHIYAFNHKTKQLLTPLSKSYDGQGFDLAGGVVVWSDSTPETSGIHLYNLATKKETIISKNGTSPSTDGHTVVWRRDPEVVAYDIATGTTNTIGKGIGPRVDGGWIVWTGKKLEGDLRVFG
jgi:hypothetical protein